MIYMHRGFFAYYAFRVFFLAVVVVSTGCITSSYHRSNEEYGHVHREFTAGLAQGHQVIIGTREGYREIEGEKYHYMRFGGILKGEGRYLDVVLPVKERATPAESLGKDGLFHETGGTIMRPGYLTIRESSSSVKPGNPAYCVFQRCGTSDMDAFYALFNQRKGMISDPVEIMKKHFMVDISGPVYPLVVVRLDFSNTGKYTARALVREKAPDGKTVVACEGVDIDGYEGPRLGVKWKVRNRPVYVLRQFGYIGTIIADVATSPVQLVMLVLTGLAGPGVR